MSRVALTPRNLMSLSTDPTIPSLHTGDTYYNSASKSLRAYDGTTWHETVVLDGAQTLSGSKTFTGGIVANSAITGSGTVTLTGAGASSVGGVLSATAHASTGLIGATAASRWAGATPSGAPASGTFLLGDWIVAQNGHFFVCTTAGSPGTWTDIAVVGAVTSVAGRTGAVTLTAADVAAGTFPGANTFSAAQSFTGGVTTTLSTGSGLGVRSGASGSKSSLDIGRTASETSIGVSAAVGDFTIATAAGETIHTSGGTYRFGVSGTERLSISSTGVAITGTATVSSSLTVATGSTFAVGTKSSFTSSRAVTTNPSDTVDVGTFSTTGGALEIRLHCHLAAPAAGSTASVSKVYEITTSATMGTLNTWYLLLPVDSSASAAATNDFALEIQRTASGTFKLRFRQKSIASTGAITYLCETMGDTAVTIVSSSTITAAPAAVTTIHPSNALTAAAGQIGIGTESPAVSLHVAGTGLQVQRTDGANGAISVIGAAGSAAAEVSVTNAAAGNTLWLGSITTAATLVSDSLANDSVIVAGSGTLRLGVGSSTSTLQVESSDVTITDGGATRSVPRGTVAAANGNTNTTGVTTTATLVPGTQTATFTTIASRRYKVSIVIIYADTVAGDQIAFSVKDGGASAPTNASATVRNWASTPGSTSTVSTSLSFDWLPSAGSHTLGVFGFRGAGTGTITLGNTTANYVSSILIDDIGT